MNRTQKVIQSMQEAIAKGERKTRKEWARDTGLSLIHITRTILKNPHLREAVHPLRAEGDSGQITLDQERRKFLGKTRWRVRVIRVPQCAIVAAGLQFEREVAFKAEAGKIVLTAVEVK